MLYYADLHLHSKYSRAVSQQMSLEGLAEGAVTKGLQILATGDFSHPAWFQELKSKLIKSESEGLFSLKGFEKTSVRFMLTNEISIIFSSPKGVKKVHMLLHFPSLESVEQLNDLLSKKGNLAADGRPTFGKTTPAEAVELVESVDRDAFAIPAHAWTPWFGVFGSKSGFDSLKDAFEDKAKSIFAIETGMSSDPAMNRRVSSLDKITMVSNSDAHSNHPWRLGRECNAFEFSSFPSFLDVRKAIETRKNFAFTVEVIPSYGKYHFDGHRDCGFSCDPAESKKLNGVCPKCRKRLTIGVLTRVEELADRPEGFELKGDVPFKTVLPLHELLSAFYKSSVSSKKVSVMGAKMLEGKSELFVLLEENEEGLLNSCGDANLVRAVLKNRAGKVEVKPGFDGEYGVPSV